MPDANARQIWMQDLRSLNFEPLRATFPDLANMGGYAEHYAHSDPESSLVKLRNFAERVVDHIYAAQKLVRAPQSTFVDLLNNSSFRMVASDLVLDKLHLLRKLGNRAAHGEGIQASDAVRCVREAWQLARWLHVTFLSGKPADFFEFKYPPVEGIDSKAEVKRKAKALAEENALKEERLKQALQELTDLRATEKAAKPSVQPQTDPPTEWLAKQQEASAAVAAQLHFNEDNTRKWLIDRDLRLAGWDVPAGTASNDSVGQEVEVQHQPTTTKVGYCDYVLWDDNGKPLAVVEAKKTTVDARQGQRQAELYADGLEKMHGQRPMIFFTNGHDIWVWDDAAGYPPRSVYGFFSKDTLQYRVGFQRRERQDLVKVRPDPAIAGRLYQIESITRVAERFTARHRKALVVQATGTGKTRVAIALAKLLIEARWAKRVLFLCDRKELRKQAKNAFNDFLDEPLYVIGQANDVGKLDARIYIGIYQGLINDYEDFDVGFFDLVIADESHRSIYNLYGDLFKYFDALQIGLTATPVEMVSRSTCQLFGCDYKLPTANYPLEQAIVDGNLVPFKVVAHTTKFLREGIKAKHLTDEQIAALEDQGIDPNTLEFDAKEIDDAVFNKDTNRIILRNLMDNGIRDAERQLPGKSIVFARNIDHARLLSSLFDEMYPQFAGKLCRVIHSQEPRAEDLIDQFKSNNELRIAISVDMLDTGIDVPEVVNLVFAKPVKSKVKFWQMIGRGTRLCKNLFGPGLDKTEFQIFDHWANFAFHDLNADEAEPSVAKPLTQRRYEARIDLATRALARSDIPAFDAVAQLLQQDAAALPDGTIAVRERWQAVQQARDAKLVHQFAPVTRQILLETVAPLMSALEVRGQGDALRWDLLITKAQAAAIDAPDAPNPHRADVLAWLHRLPPHLNPVRAKANELKAIRSDTFWQTADFAALDGMRVALREIIHLAEPPSPPPTPPLVTRLDIREDTGEIEITVRPTRIKSVDYGIYRKAVQSVLEPLFDTDPVLKKIRRGEPVTDEEFDKLNSLLHTLNPDVNLATLREFFLDTAVPLAAILRSVVGHDHETVEARFTAFAQMHALNSQQLRFLALLKEHIRQYGALKPEKLFEAPFTTVHAEGLGGVFPNDQQLHDVVRLVRSFGEPVVVPLTT